MDINKLNRRVSVIGLGYVGLNLANLFAKAGIGKIICYDISKKRIESLKEGIDHNKVYSASDLSLPNLVFTNDENDLNQADFHIVTVGTPVTIGNQPDLQPLKEASITIAKQLKEGDIVVYESTVYPGVTEDICVPILEEGSSLKSIKDFCVGYSPERVNVGDSEHTLANTCKLISAQNDESLQIVKSVYESIITAEVHPVSNIKSAEAAKLLENTQRDLNISLMNELSMMLHRMGLDSREVINAAKTKWNFVPVEPGLVGGHCISVDPYYFTYLAKHINYNETLINTSRQINDEMSSFIVSEMIKGFMRQGIPLLGAKAAIMGFSFKANCADIRNTRAFNIYKELESYGIDVKVYDPVVEPESVKECYGIELASEEEIQDMDAMIFTVKHDQFREYCPEFVAKRLRSFGLVMDLKWIWQPSDFSDFNIQYWSL